MEMEMEPGRGIKWVLLYSTKIALVRNATKWARGGGAPKCTCNGTYTTEGKKRGISGSEFP